MRLLGLAIIGMVLSAPVFAEQAVDSAGLPVICQTVSVSDAANIALKNSPSVASRRALVSAAAAKVGMAKSMTRPQMSASAFATTSNMQMIVPGPASVQPQNFNLTSDKPRFDQKLMLMVPIYTGGSLKSQVNSAGALKQASVFDAAAAELDVVAATRSAYYKALLARSYIDVYQQRVDEAAERLKLAEASFNEGKIAKYDLLRNQTDLAEARQQLNNAQGDLEMAMIDLRDMMGVSQSSKLTLSQELAVQPEVAALEELQASAIKQRPEVQATRERVNSQREQIKVAKSSYKPQIYATAMGNLSVMKSDGMSKSTDTGYLLGVAAAIPVFDGGLRKSSVDEAQAMLAQMQADEKDITLNVSKSVASGYIQFTTATRNIALSQNAISQAEEDYRVIKLRYEAGKATNVEVLDALASLTRARTMYAEALYSQNVARESLNRAVGQR